MDIAPIVNLITKLGVAHTIGPCLEVWHGFFRLIMKQKFHAYMLLWTFWKKLIS